MKSKLKKLKTTLKKGELFHYLRNGNGISEGKGILVPRGGGFVLHLVPYMQGGGLVEVPQPKKKKKNRKGGVTRVFAEG